MEEITRVRFWETETKQVFAIIDIDCSVKKGFDKEDQIQLETLARLIGESCDW